VRVDPAHLVGAGGALGALLRYAVSNRIHVEELPAATFAVNVAGSFVLGLVAFLGADSRIALFVGTGACGSFTTFSSFSFETVRLWETGDRGRAAANAVGNLLGAGVALGLAWLVARAALGG
jgi:CrcB protein